jgi:hypothetical protein
LPLQLAQELRLGLVSMAVAWPRRGVGGTLEQCRGLRVFTEGVVHHRLAPVGLVQVGRLFQCLPVPLQGCLRSILGKCRETPGRAWARQRTRE